MKDRDALAVVGLLVLFALSRRRGTPGPGIPIDPTDSGEGSSPGGWSDAVDAIWPMPRLVTATGGNFVPEISDGFYRYATPNVPGSGPSLLPLKLPTLPQKGHRQHHGVDITYPGSFAATLWQKRNGIPNKTPDVSKGGYWVPRGTRALAIEAGKVIEVERTGRGTHVVFEVAELGGIRRRAFYQHLESVTVAVNQQVDKGGILGTIGDDPSHADVRHLHFEVWDFRAGSWRKLKPEPIMARWALADQKVNT